MSDALLYWAPLCALVSQLRCWVRIASQTGGETLQGRWGRLLTMPAQGYLEASDGPVPIRDVEWVEISAKRIVGGIAGRRRQMVDIKDDILAGLHEAGFTWEFYEGTWSMEGVFDNEPVPIVRILNPLRSTSADA